MEIRLWDSKEKTYLKVEGNYRFYSIKEAADARDKFLDQGMYPDEPITVIQVVLIDDDQRATNLN